MPIVAKKSAMICKLDPKTMNPVLFNKRTEKSIPIKVGKRGGLFIKSSKAKAPRYLRGTCKKIESSGFETAMSLNRLYNKRTLQMKNYKKKKSKTLKKKAKSLQNRIKTRSTTRRHSM